MTYPLWKMADERAAERRLEALLHFNGRAARDSVYGDYGWVGASRMNQRTYDALVIAGIVSGWGSVVFTQGGLNASAVAASARTHNGLDVADIQTRGRKTSEILKLVDTLQLCGAIGFIRGTSDDNISDGMVPHCHVVMVGAQHAHADARAQIYNTTYGFKYGGAGLAGLPHADWWGPKRRPLIEWSQSKYNPKNGWRP